MEEHAITLTEKERSTFLHRLLVAYDFTEAAEAALRYAIDLSHHFGSSICVIYVQSTAEIAGEMDCRLSMLAAHREIESEMQALRKRLADQKVKHSVLHRVGVIADVLISEAVELHADLVLLGAYGSRQLDPPRLGSTAQAMLRDIACAVMVVGPEAVFRDRKTAPTEALLYVIPNSKQPRSTKFAELLAQGLGARVTIACAANQQNEFTGNFGHKTLERQCEQVAARMRAAHLSISWRLLYGHVGGSIANLAEEIRADLILLDPEIDSEPSFPRDGIVSDAIQQAPCPVLIVSRQFL